MPMIKYRKATRVQEGKFFQFKAFFFELRSEPELNSQKVPVSKAHRQLDIIRSVVFPRNVVKPGLFVYRQTLFVTH